MALAGHVATITVASTDTTGSAVTGINSIEYSPSIEHLETTDFSDTTGAKKRITGLKDGTLSMSGDYETGTGPDLVRSSFESGADIWVRIAPNGTTGFKVPCKVKDWKLSLSVEGKAEVSFSLVFNGATGTF